MFGSSVNKKELSEVAQEFLGLLEKYQKSNGAAKDVLVRSKKLIHKAINMEMEYPIMNGFFPEEFWEDGELFGIEDLSNAAAKFNVLIMGAESLEELRKSVKDIVKQADEDELELRKKLKLKEIDSEQTIATSIQNI